ncbi:hypothetical protein DSO57_1025895 [Entomophthora muscae]|uniref:Uncharacterized protein n=1 Tax=Entomophthora muscae TaxID=34485 RepID=A0ACC2UNA4_9FUNG|nr:hypothetical protein DSO57_1025895 [Entomophthora muscae]
MTSNQQPMACDQCYTNRVKCNRLAPCCSNCLSKKLPCSWDRQSVCRRYQSYQNVDTFAVQVPAEAPPTAPLSSKVTCIRFELTEGFPKRSSKKQPKQDCKPQSSKALQNQLSKSISIRKSSSRCTWGLVIQKWLSSSHLRVYFYSLVGFTGVSLSQATERDQEILIELLLNKLLLKASLVKPQSLVFAPQQEFASLLLLATDAYFHFFNPYNSLFTRQSYESLPRSPLLRFCVWRMGLSFIPDSPIKAILLKKIDPYLLKLTKPSKVKASLDTMQSFLILIFNMENSPLSIRRGFFHGSVLSMVFSLGLHCIDPLSTKQRTQNSINRSIERILAYRLVIFYHFVCAVKLDSFHFTIGSFYNPSLRLPPAAFTSYHSQFLASLPRNNSSFHGVSDSGPSNQTLDVFFEAKSFITDHSPSSSFQSFTRVFGSSISTFSPALKDLCVLLSNECLYEESVIMKGVHNIRLQLQACGSPGKLILPRIQTSLQKLKDSFASKAHCLDNLLKFNSDVNSYSHSLLVNESAEGKKKFSFHDFVASDLLFEALSNPTSLYLRETNQGNQMIIDTLLFLRIHYYFCCLVLFDLASCIDPKNLSAPFSMRPLAGITTPYITAGLVSANRLIDLLNQVSMEPFYFIRLSFLGSASTFIIRHYTTYCAIPQSSNPSCPYHILAVRCLRALLRSREILIMSLSCPFIGTQAKQFLIMFDFFLALHHIVLPAVDSSSIQI